MNIEEGGEELCEGDFVVVDVLVAGRGITGVVVDGITTGSAVVVYGLARLGSGFNAV